MSKEIDKYILYKESYFYKETPIEVMDILTKYLHDSTRLRIFQGTPDKYWLEEHDIIGTIGRSCGELRVPLLLVTARSNFGGAILTDRIQMITKNKKVIYQNPAFVIKPFEIKPITNEKLLRDGYTHEVHYESELIANFKSETLANRYVAFMEGKRNKL